jgi:hypothetical protein
MVYSDFQLIANTVAFTAIFSLLKIYFNSFFRVEVLAELSRSTHSAE